LIHTALCCRERWWLPVTWCWLVSETVSLCHVLENSVSHYCSKVSLTFC